MVFAPAAIDPERGAAIEAKLRAWSAAGKVVADVLPQIYPAVREAIPAGHALVDAGAVGIEAVGSLARGVPLSDARLAADLAVLDRAANPNESATELPILRPVRRLVAAAAKQGGRKGLTDEQWRLLVISTAYPGPADPAR